MGKKLPPEEMELYRRVDEVLHYLWDPLGVSDEPSARDEYRAYLPVVFSLLRDGADEDTIAAYLVDTERITMGLSGAPDRAREAAATLGRWSSLLRGR